MADKKISALIDATTPLAGTEVLPIVQSAATVKVAVSNLTAGRAVSALSLSAPTIGAGSGFSLSLQSNGIDNATLNTDGMLGVGIVPSAWASNSKAVQVGYSVGYTALSQATGGDSNITNNVYLSAVNTWTAIASLGSSRYQLDFGAHKWYVSASGISGNVVSFTQALTLNSDTNLTLNAGNLIQGTAAKGVDFTANIPATGMTSQLLNWYEEGTWTPNQGAGLTVVGAFSSSGTYTRIGRQVTVRGQVVGATSVAVNAAGTITSNLPYAAATTHAGSMFNAAVNVSGVVQVTSSSIVAATTVAATANITFTATYQV